MLKLARYTLCIAGLVSIHTLWLKAAIKPINAEREPSHRFALGQTSYIWG